MKKNHSAPNIVANHRITHPSDDPSIAFNIPHILFIRLSDPLFFVA